MTTSAPGPDSTLTDEGDYPEIAARSAKRGRRSPRRSDRVRRVIALGCAALLLLGISTASPVAATTPGLVAQVVPGTLSLRGVACPSATTCEAVGLNPLDQGVVVPITNGVPGAAQLVPGTQALLAVACPSATTCEAVGLNPLGQGVVVRITNGTPGAAQLVPGTNELVGVACPSATSCVAVGQNPFGDGVVVLITNGTPGAAQLVPQTRGLSGVACPSATSCVAVGANRSIQGVVVPITNGVPGAAAVVPGTPLIGVACPSAISCEAVGGNTSLQGVLVPITNGNPGAAQAVPGTTELFGVACPSATSCEAVGENHSLQGLVVPVASGTPGAAQVVPGTTSFFGVACPDATTCQAVGESFYSQGMVLTLRVGVTQPTLTTSASSNTLLGGPVTDGATLSGGSNPTGTVTFNLYGPNDTTCASPPVSTSVVGVGAGGAATSPPFTPGATGTYRFTAAYSGDANNGPASSPCNAPDESVVVAPFAPPTFTRTISGDLVGPVTVNAGDSVQIVNARVVGPVTVTPGGSLSIVNSQIRRGITASNPKFLSICGAFVSGPSPNQALVVSNATVPIRIGDPVTGCAGNRFAGDVTLSNNLALTVGANFISKSGNLNSNGPGNTVIKANNVFGTLACAGNNPPPTNAGQPNTAGSKSGQCIGL